jgi:inhibitor of KinA
LLLSFGNIIDKTVNRKIIRIHHAINNRPFPGFIESVPAYSSVAVFYDAVFIRNNHSFSTAYEYAKDMLSKIAEETVIDEKEIPGEAISIPVYYDGEDLEHIAAVHQLSTDEVVRLHTERSYHVYMTGFLPGFAYMGTLDEKIATARKENPAINVAAGSVGIAGEQTGIYPFNSPGGWQIIGTTPLTIFDKTKTNPCLLKAGDEVRFVSISKNEFEKLNGH